MTKLQQYGLDKLSPEELNDIRDEIDREFEITRCLETHGDPVRERIEAKILSGEIRELTVEQAIDLEERLERCEANPNNVIPWEQAWAELKKRIKHGS